MLALAACGGGMSDAAQVKQAWSSFFSTKGSVAEHVALVQTGSKLLPLIQGFLSDPLMRPSKATIYSVTLQGANKAKVVYEFVSTGVSFGRQTGYAYKIDGKWKVGRGSACQLNALATRPVCPS